MLVCLCAVCCVLHFINRLLLGFFLVFEKVSSVLHFAILRFKSTCVYLSWVVASVTSMNAQDLYWVWC